MNKEELKELAATLNGIADGKAWDVEYAGGYWGAPGMNDGHDPMIYLSSGYKIRLKPWSLPPPPDGMQWHRDDWTEEMLLEGWRPHLLGEVDNGDEEYLYYGKWRNGSYGSLEPTEASDPHRRTKAPLPQPDPYAELKAAHAAGKVIQALGNEGWYDTNPVWSEHGQYRIKPEQQKVPFQPSDVPPGSVFRFKGFNDLLTPFCVKDERVYFFSDTSHCWGYEWLMRNAEINRSNPLTGKWNPEAWEPCYKLIDTP